MKHGKKLIALFLTTLMLIGAVAPMSVSASTVDNSLYENANDGDLLYRVDFRGDDMWQPNVISTDSTPTVTASADGSYMSTTAAKGNIGGEVKGLYLNDTTKYTIIFDTYKSGYGHGIAVSYNSATATFGTSSSGFLGVELLNDSNRHKFKMIPYVGSGYYRTYLDSSNSANASYTLDGTDMWTLALEIDCVSKTITLYHLNDVGNWELSGSYSSSYASRNPQSFTAPDGCLNNEPLKLTFWQGANAAKFANVEIRKGNIINTGSRDMSDVRLQFKTNDTNSALKDMRVVSVIDSTNYDSVGYDVVVKKGDTTLATETIDMTTVYTSLTAKYGTQTVTLETLGYHKDSGYMTAFTINNISCTEEITVILTPYTVKDGTKTPGNAITLTVDADAETATFN